MPALPLREGVDLAYVEDYFGPPWLRDSAEIVLLVHGTAESSAVWYAWVPPLAGRYRVVRPDLPGFGRSRIPADQPFDWSAAHLADALAELVDHLGGQAVHVVGAKYGGSIGVQLAARHPSRVRTLTVISGPMRIRGGQGAVDVNAFAARIDADLRRWVEETMGDRLGAAASDAQKRWWIDHMAAADPRAARECALGTVALDLLEPLRRITAPTLFITAQGNRMIGPETYREWVSYLRDGRLVLLDGDSYHPAASDPQACVAAVLPLIAGRG